MEQDKKSSPLAISFDTVIKTYPSRQGGIEALKGLSLDVPAGQIYGFAGPNGAGKSTAIKILVGLIRPDAGKVKIFGHMGGSKEAKRLVGFLPEVTLYHEFMGAQELLRIHATLAGIASSERDKKCDEALAKVGLAERRKSRLKEFSKGMKQRFGIAQAIVGDPKLLVLDELTSGLDPQAQASLLTLLTELREQGLTIFFSSHHLREIEKVCDSVAVIHKGHLQCSGSLDSVLGKDERVSLKVRVKEGHKPSGPGIDWRKDSDGQFVATVKKTETISILKALEDVLESIHTVETRRQTLEELFHKLTSDSLEKVKA